MNEECLLSGNIQTHSLGGGGLGKLTSLKIWAGVEVKPKPFMGGSMDISGVTQKSGAFIEDQASCKLTG